MGYCYLDSCICSHLIIRISCINNRAKLACGIPYEYILTFICGLTKEKQHTNFIFSTDTFSSFRCCCCQFCVATSQYKLVFIVLFCIRQLTCTPVFFTRIAHFLSFYLSHFRPFAQSTTWSDSCKQTTCNEVKSEKKTIEILICISFVEFEMYQTNSTFHTKYTHTKPIIKCFVFFPTFYSCLCAAA